jgi:hypothetical protein
MALPTYRSGEPLFTIIMRDPDARNLLTRWSATSRSIAARVEDNRMHIYDHNTLSLFIVTWGQKWDNIVIWDPWTKRHLTF